MRGMKRNAIVAMGLAAVAAGAFAAGDLRTESDRRAFADALFSRGLYRQAAAEYGHFTEEFPKSADLALVYFRQGESLRLSGDRVNALKAYKRVIDLPDTGHREAAMFKRAALFTESGNAEAAEELYTELLKANPSPAVRERALYYRAGAYSDLKRNADAVRDLEAVLQDFPKGEMADYARLELGRVLGMPGDLRNEARSKELLRTVASGSATPRLAAEALYQLGSSAYAAGDFAGASDAFHDLFAKYPQDLRVPAARLPAAWSFCKSNRTAEAREACDAALAAQPEPVVEVELRYVAALGLFRLAKYPEAAAAFIDVAALPAAAATPFGATARYQAALCHFKRGAFGECRETVRPVLSDKTLREEALWLLAEASASDKDGADEAIENYRRLIAEFPASKYGPDALYRLGFRLRQREAWGDAADTYRSLAVKFPESTLAPKARFAAAECLSAAGQGARALVEWQTYLRDFPKDEGAAEALFRQTTELIRLSRMPEALTSVDELLRRFPDSKRKADACYWRGVLLRDANDPKAAVDAFRAALAANPSEAIRRDARFALAQALQAAGQTAEAAREFQALMDDPVRARFTPAQFAWLSEQQFEAKDYAHAAQSARAMAEAAKTPAERQTAWTLLGRAERAAGKAREAEDAFRKACDESVLTVYAPEATLRLAELLFARGENAEAERFFRLAGERSVGPEFEAVRIHAYVGIGRAALAAGNREEAAKYLHLVCVLFHDKELLPPVLRETIVLLDSLGRTDEANDLRKSLREDYGEEP